MKLLAIPLGCQKTATKWLVISNQKTVAKWLVIPQGGVVFLRLFFCPEKHCPPIAAPSAPAARPDHRPHPPPATDPTGEIKGTIKGSEPLIPNNPLEKTASYRRRPVSRWLIIPRESGTTSRYCPLRGVFFLLDSGLRRNDELMDYLG